MKFISYAQNFEDVMLWRALKNVEKGFYIDVGAWSPDVDSVTKAFYDRGWRGINIEPNREFYDQLMEKRPNDINLRIAVSDKSGTMNMNFLGNSGLSTLEDAIAKKHTEAGWEINKEQVEVATLSEIWKTYVLPGQEVHFLKVDVEGSEKLVLKGNDWKLCRPWIIIVEATLPMSQTETHEEWEPLLIEAGYLFAYADGLNRFYVAEEHNGLLPAFKYPPNFFDEFVLAAQIESENKVVLLQKDLETTKEKIEELNHSLLHWKTETERLHQELQLAEHKTKQAESQTIQLLNELDSTKSKIEKLNQSLLLWETENERLHRELQLAEYKAKQAESQTIQLLNELDSAKSKIEELNQSSHHWWTVADGLNQEMQRVYSSRSWRITKPLRWLAHKVRQIRAFARTVPHRIRRGLKKIAKPILTQGIQFVLVRPKLKRLVISFLRKFPKIEARLKQFAVNRGLLGYGAATPTNSSATVPIELSHLTPYARQIYHKLKTAVEERRKENR